MDNETSIAFNHYSLIISEFCETRYLNSLIDMMEGYRKLSQEYTHIHQYYVKENSINNFKDSLSGMMYGEKRDVISFFINGFMKKAKQMLEKDIDEVLEKNAGKNEPYPFIVWMSLHKCVSLSLGYEEKWKQEKFKFDNALSLDPVQNIFNTSIEHINITQTPQPVQTPKQKYINKLQKNEVVAQVIFEVEISDFTNIFDERMDEIVRKSQNYLYGKYSADVKLVSSDKSLPQVCEIRISNTRFFLFKQKHQKNNFNLFLVGTHKKGNKNEQTKAILNAQKRAHKIKQS